MLDRNISQYGVIFIADGDTLRGGLDTGADRTVVEGRYHKREDLLPKAPIRNAHDSIMHWHQLRLKDFKWGDVHMQNLIVYVNDGGMLLPGTRIHLCLDVMCYKALSCSLITRTTSLG